MSLLRKFINWWRGRSTALAKFCEEPFSNEDFIKEVALRRPPLRKQPATITVKLYGVPSEKENLTVKVDVELTLKSGPLLSVSQFMDLINSGDYYELIVKKVDHVPEPTQ
jgi:hypothetical protein